MAIFDAIKNVFQAILYGLHDSLGTSWAWSIILLTIIVRLILLPLGIRQTRSMFAMQRLQPYVKQLQQQYKNDKQELNVRMMEFYRDNNVNPLSSCLPLVLQLPVFFALYRVLKDFADDAKKGHVHHGDKNFTFLSSHFVHDITAKVQHAGWAAVVLVAFYVISQMVSSLLTTAQVQGSQRVMMLVLPLVFIPIVRNFPVGLLLYWITTNLWQIGQTQVLMRAIKGSAAEVVLPADSKGNKKVVVPKGTAADKGAAGSGKPTRSSTKPTPTPSAKPAPQQGQARRNKRRR